MTATTAPSPEVRTVTYDDKTVRGFMFWSITWGLVGLLVGLLIAIQMSFPSLNLGELHFGRLRPLHTNAVIFALVGNMMFAGVYHSTQRLLKTRMASDLLSKIHLWGWQLIIVGAAVTLPLGITQSKEYAELEWFLDIAVALVWVAFGINFFWTLGIRNERNLYVSIWFYISTIITVAMLYIVNNLSLPVSGTHSYGLFAGAQDALTQWWYGHNAVAFFLTTPILGIMYYYLPKAAGRPVYSYRLSIVHFWSLVFIYIWAGPHHLLNTALPDWAQTLGMTFSLMLWAPSWGGMLNGLLTLRGAWHKVRTDPVLKFFVVGVTSYGMATFEGPLLSIKSVSALGHYTDWIIAHVHNGALGWNGFMAAGMFYWLAPRLWGKPLFSTKLADLHFWIATFGILLYVGSMWIAGVTSGLMQAEITDTYTLANPQWALIIDAVRPLYMARILGGVAYIIGWVLMIYNLLQTAKAGSPQTAQADVTVWRAQRTEVRSFWGLMTGRPVVLSVLGLLVAWLFASGDYNTPSGIAQATVGLVLLAGVVLWAGALLYKSTGKGHHDWHDQVESHPLAFSILTLVAVAAGGVIELVPGLVMEKKVPLTAKGEAAVMPYTPLELAGRDIYVSEGCYNCHSQMIRPFLDEQMRYGEPSKIEESMFDHPFQWGSKRTGPDLARIGDNSNRATYKDATWHWNHMINPQSIVPQSNMPSFPWLAEKAVDVDGVQDKMNALQALGVPYVDSDIAASGDLYRKQADAVVAYLAGPTSQIDAKWDSEMVALIAYLDRLGEPGKPGVELQIDPAALATEATRAADSGSAGSQGSGSR